MRRLLYLCLLLAIVAFGIASQAIAQSTDDNNQKFAIFGGLYMPSGSTLQDQGATTWKSFGIAMNLKMDDDGRPVSFLSLDCASISKTYFTGAKYGLNYTRLFHRPVTGDSWRGFYWGIGGGISAASEKIDEQLFQIPPVFGEDNSGMQLNVSVLGGYDFNQNFYTELRYTKTTELAPNVDFSGLTMYIGTRSLF
jgi:hypothetical protein